MPFVVGYLGNIVKDPEIKETGKGKQLCTFKIANQEGWGEYKRTDFISCIAWGKTASVIYKNLRKGDSAIFCGRWENNPWQKNEKGYDIPDWKLNVDKIVFLPKNKDRSDEDDGFLPVDGGSPIRMGGTSVEVDPPSDGMEFAPIVGGDADLPF